MSGTRPRDPADLPVAPADGYAAMFEDAPPPTQEDLRDLEPSAASETPPTGELAPEERRKRLRIASVA